MDYYFDDQCVKLLTSLVRNTNAQLVIISTLRRLYDWETLLAGFAASKFPVDHIHPDRMDGVVEYSDQLIMGGKDRAEEIMTWLDNHLEVKNWCVLDDEMFTIRPRRASRIPGSTCWMQRTTPSTLVSKVASNCSSLVLRISLFSAMPAFANNTSICKPVF